MAKRKAEDVQPLDAGEPPQEKKIKTEKKYVDQIMIRYEPASLDRTAHPSYPASYYTLKAQCDHGFFESDKIPDPPEMKITYDCPFSSLGGFLDLAMGLDTHTLTVIVVDEKCYSRGVAGQRCDGKNAACNALAILPWAIYFGHTQTIELLRAIVVDVATRTDAYENEPLFGNDAKDTCMQALLQLTQQMDHGKDYCRLLVALTDSQEVKRYIRDPGLTARFGQVFRAMQMTNWISAPEEITTDYLCPFCDKYGDLWTGSEYAKMVMDSDGKPTTPDWQAIRDAKIASIKSCKDHPLWNN